MFFARFRAGSPGLAAEEPGVKAEPDYTNFRTQSTVIFQGIGYRHDRSEGETGSGIRVPPIR